MGFYLPQAQSTIRPVMDRPRAQTLSFPQIDKTSTKQVLITDFFKSQGLLNSLITNSCLVGTSQQREHHTRPSPLMRLEQFQILLRMSANRKKCRYCPNLDRSGKITNTSTRKTCSTCKKNFTCRSSNLIYGITCHTCNNQYMLDKPKELFLSISNGSMRIQSREKILSQDSRLIKYSQTPITR